MAIGRRTPITPAALVLCALAVVSIVTIPLACRRGDGPISGQVLDEAMSVRRLADSFPAADEDYFRLMDRGTPLTPDEIRGRNTWIVWTGGNDRFWNYLSNHSYGVFDLLKTLSSHPKLGYGRDSRWKDLGLVNEPCFEKATAPDPNRHGLWLDKRVEGPDCPPDPFANATKYPASASAHAARQVPVGSFYGAPSGIVGLRLFPNPDFDDAAKAKWDPVRYYEDSLYYDDQTLVRPYRVGMSCGFCHVGPSPIKPPADPEHPKWENLNSNPGAQYFWINRIFVWTRRLGHQDQLHLAVVPHLASRGARYLPRLHRQHQQPAHDECAVLARRTARPVESRGQGATRGRRPAEPPAE